MKLNKKDKVALVATHIAMSLFKELTAAQENPQEQEPEDGEDQQVLAEETILCEWEGNKTDIDAEFDDWFVLFVEAMKMVVLWFAVTLVMNGTMGSASEYMKLSERNM